MAFALSHDATRAGYRLAAFETIGSTSTEALRRAAEGETGPLWLVAGQQTAGNGRRGSAWQSPPGNLAASLLLTLDQPPATLAQLGFVAGLALGRALDCCCGRDGASIQAGRRPAPQDEDESDLHSAAGPRAEVLRSNLEARTLFALKWPNDVLADGAKLAGILLQTEQVGTRRAVVIGIGANVAHAPLGLPYAAASLSSLGCAASAEMLFTALSQTWLALYASWDGGLAFDIVRRAWLARAAGLGGEVAVTGGSAISHGTFETIDEHGQLVIKTQDGGFRRVSAGDVHFGEAATARIGSWTVGSAA